MARKSDNKVWFLSLVLLFVLAAFGFLQSPFFNVQQVMVEGNSHVAAEELTALANIGIGTNIFKVSVGDAEKSVLLHPYVESVTAVRKLPHTVVLKITERKPVAMLPVQNGFVKVDKDGVFLERSETWPGEPLPIISGIQLPGNLNLGQPIPSPGLIQGLKTILEMPPELYQSVGELSAGNRDKLIMYTRDGLEIRLGVADSANQKFAVMKQFLQDSNYKPYRLGYYVDLTSGKPVIGKR